MRPYRGYVRNGVAGWTADSQAALLEVDTVGHGCEIYRDKMLLSDVRGKRASALTERTRLLSPEIWGTDGGVIVVATIRALALNVSDLMSVLVQATNCRISIEAVSEKLVIPPSPVIHVVKNIEDVLKHWDREKKVVQTSGCRTGGVQKAAAAAAVRREQALKIARPLWHLPSCKMSTANIAAKSGMSISALYMHLGGRKPARKTLL